MDVDDSDDSGDDQARAAPQRPKTISVRVSSEGSGETWRIFSGVASSTNGGAAISCELCHYGSGDTSSMPQKTLMKCAGCLRVYYCCKEHQRLDWKRHRQCCKAVQRELAAVARAEAEARLWHSDSVPFHWRRFASSSQLCAEKRPSTRPPHGESGCGTCGGSVCGSVCGSMSDLLTPTSASGSGGHAKRARFPLTAIGERRSSIGAGEAARLADVGREAAESAGSSTSTNADAFLNLKIDARFQFDSLMPRQAAFMLRVRCLALCVAGALHKYGYCVVDHFLGDGYAREIQREAMALYMTPGLFADGQLMKGMPPCSGQSSKSVRSDVIYWFDNRVDRGASIGLLVSMIDSIVCHLSEHLPPYRINGRSRAMIACYPGNDTRYVRHVDNPDRDGRCITTIYYLNDGWNPNHGGILRLYPETSSSPLDVEPLFDRLLFFWSDRRNPHEVLPAHSNRFAITIWYFDAEERASALAREQQQDEQMEELPKKESVDLNGVVDTGESGPVGTATFTLGGV